MADELSHVDVMRSSLQQECNQSLNPRLPQDHKRYRFPSCSWMVLLTNATAAHRS